MKIGYLTDKGKRRIQNEDSIKVLSDLNFFMLADGVGGNKAGEIASKSALEALEEYLNRNPFNDVDGSENMFRYFENAVNFVNEFILQLTTTKPEYAGMATTLVFAYIKDKIMYVSNVGDSRVYFIHDDEMHQITDDHTYVNDLVRMGAITKDEAEHHKKKNIITRAIGANAYNFPDCYNIFIEANDRVLICSDGLYDEVSDEEIQRCISNADDMQKCAVELVDMANENGGSDNISVICIDVGGAI